jgi:hypothetical protein
MPSAELMGWNAKGKRWFKRMPTEFLKPGIPKMQVAGCPTLAKTYPQIFIEATKEGSRAAANQWWRDKLVELTVESTKDERQHADYWRHELDEHKARLSWSDSQGNDEGRDDEQRQVALVEGILDRTTLPDPNEWSFRAGSTIPADYKSTAADAALWADRLSHNTKPGQKHSVTALVTMFLKERESDSREDRLYNLTKHLEHLTRYLETDDIRLVKGLTLTGFKADLLTKVGDERAQNVMSTVVRFLWWCYEAEAIHELPRNIRSKSLKVEIGAKEILPWDLDQVKLLFENLDLTGSPDRHRLWYLLSLNVGIQAQEISMLSNHDPGVPKAAREAVYYSTPRIDWSAGTITRKRAKTAHFKNVPIVTTKLWPETLDLLNKLGSKEPATIVLTGRSGKPLVNHSLTKGKGKCWVKRVDTVGTEFRRLRLRIKAATKKGLPPIRNLRHMAGTELNNHAEYGRYSPYFLGHSPRDVTSKHYVVPSPEQFADAVDWLRSRFLPVIVQSTDPNG